MKLLSVFVILAALFCHVRMSSSVKNGFVCQPVEDSCALPLAPVGPQGRPGKMGIKGDKGEVGDSGVKGDRGNPGVVDNVKVNNIEKTTGDLAAKISSLERTIHNLEDSISSLTEDINAGCKFFHGGKCYRALVHAQYDVPYQKCVDYCNERGMEPAEITGPENLKKLLKYVASEIPFGSATADIYIGMSYNPANQELKFNDGSRASFVKWYINYPNSASARTSMGMVAQKNPSHAQGMYNVPKSKLQGILCQK